MSPTCRCKPSLRRRPREYTVQQKVWRWGYANGVDEPVHLGDGQDIGKGLGLGDPDHLERLPVARHGMGVEELDATEGHAEGAGSESTALLEMEEVVADLRLGETIGRQPVLSGQMPDAAEIPLLGTGGQPNQGQVGEHALAKCVQTGNTVLVRQRSHQSILSKGGREIVWNNSASRAVQSTSDSAGTAEVQGAKPKRRAQYTGASRNSARRERGFLERTQPRPDRKSSRSQN